MLAFPNCKINLGLNITRKRSDGYHDLETVFYPVQLKDALEIIRQPSTDNYQPSTVNQQLSLVNFSVSGLVINGPENDNLCIKAYQLLQQDFPDLPRIKMHLHKAIPMGAGLGGGSADGAFALQLLNDKFQLKLTSGQLANYALQLGSDCPFFILNKPCFATGRGEIMQPINLDLSAYQIVVINPKIHIGTAWAFGNIVPQTPQQSIKQIIELPIPTWREKLVNDFEKPAIKQYPEIGNIKELLYQYGAVYSSMTGSGSTVYGLFDIQKKIQFSFPKNYFIFSTFQVQ